MTKKIISLLLVLALLLGCVGFAEETGEPIPEPVLQITDTEQDPGAAGIEEPAGQHDGEIETANAGPEKSTGETEVPADENAAAQTEAPADENTETQAEAPADENAAGQTEAPADGSASEEEQNAEETGNTGSEPANGTAQTTEETVQQDSDGEPAVSAGEVSDPEQDETSAQENAETDSDPARETGENAEMTEEADVETAEEETPAAIDYSASCKVNVTFTEGYVTLNEGTKLYETRYASEHYAVIARGAVYVIGRSAAGEDADRLRIAYAAADGIHTAYVKPAYAYPMDAEKVNALSSELEKTAAGEKYTYQSGIVLKVLAVTYVQTEEPAITEENENTEQTVTTEEPVINEENETVEEIKAFEETVTIVEPAINEENETVEEIKAAEEPVTIVEPAIYEENETVEEIKASEQTVTEAPDEVVAENTADVQIGFAAQPPMMLFAAAPGCAERIEWNCSSVVLGQEDVVHVEAFPFTADGIQTSETVTITSNNPYVAECRDDCVIGRAIGEAQLIASTESGLTSTISVSVKAAPTAITCTQQTAVVGVNSTCQLGYTLTGTGSVTWFSSDMDVAMVNDDGVVTGYKAGTAVITAMTYNGLKAVCALTVLAEPNDLILSESELVIDEGGKAVVTGSFTGDVNGNVYLEEVTGTAEVEIECTGERTFEVKGILSGTSVARFYVYNKTEGQTYYAELSITVNPAVDSIVFENPRAAVGVNENVNLMPAAYDARGNKLEGENITLATSNKSYLKVSGTSVIGLSAGKTVTVTAKAVNGVQTKLSVKVLKAPGKATMDRTRLTVSVGETASLSVKLSDGSASAIKWTSSDPGVVEVDNEGNLRAVGAGTAAITAQTFVSAVKAVCNVTVTGAPEGLDFTQPSYSVIEGMSADTYVVFQPVGSAGKVEFSIDDPAIATVDENGRVTGVTCGSTTLRVKVHNYVTGTDASAETQIVVLPAPAEFRLGTDRTTLGKGETLDLAPIAYDRFGQPVDIAVTLSSSKNSYVEVSGTRVYGKYPGKAVITITAANGFSQKINFQTVKAPAKLTLSKTSLKLSTWQEAVLTYSLTSGSAGAVTWSSSDPGVVSVENGALRAVSAGTAVITCQSYVSAVKGTCTVTVTDSPTNIAFERAEYTVAENGSVQPVIVVFPEGAAADITYELVCFGEDEVATLSGNTVRGNYSGAATLIAKAYNYERGAYVTASCTIEVVPAPVRITVRSDRSTVGLKETVDLMPRAFDARGNELDTELKLTSSAKYLKVQEDGTVYGAYTGTATVTVTAENGVKTTKKLQVTGAPASVKILAQSTVVAVGDTTLIKAVTTGSDTADVTFSLSDDFVAVIDENGTLYGESVGVVTVTATTYNGKTASCTVNVVPVAAEIRFENSEYTVNEGESIRPALLMLPEGSFGTVTYTVSYDDGEYEIASVDPNGTVHGLVSGTAVLTARLKNAQSGTELTASATVVVLPAPMTIVAGLPAELGYKETFLASPEALDARGNRVDTTFTLKSSSSYVKVSGLQLNGASSGKSNITVTAANGKYVTQTVKVIKAPTAVNLNTTALTLQTDDSAQLKVSFGSGQTSQIVFSTDDENVALVSKDGTVTAVGIGSCSVTALAFNGKSAKCTVTVKASPAGMHFDAEQIRIAKGETYTVRPVFEPEGSYAVLEFASAAPETAKVDPATGSVTALSEGSTVITCRAYSNELGDYITADYNVVVSGYAESVNPGVAEITLGVGETYTFVPVGFDADGNTVGTSFKYATSSRYIAALSGSTVKAVKKGSAVITVTAAGGAKATVKITVLTAPASVSVDPVMKLSVGESGIVKVKLPAGQGGAVSFRSDDPAVAEVNADGTVTGKTVGTAVITATAYNGKNARCTVSVMNAPESIRFAQDVYTVNENGTVALDILYTPDDTYSGPVWTFESDTVDDIAYVDDNGVLHGVLSGSGVLTATAHDYVNDTDVSAQCTVNVLPYPVKVVFLQNRTQIGVGETVDMMPMAYDARGNVLHNTEFTLKSSSASYASVIGTSVKGVRTSSKVTITATTDNGISVSKTLAVKSAPSKVTISKTSVSMAVNSTVTLTGTVSGFADAGYDWISENRNIADVDRKSGVITARSVGTTTVRLATYNGKTASCKVTVLPESDNVWFDGELYTVGEGGTITVTAKVPDGTASKIVYASANPYVARVDAATGKVTAVKQGNTRIVATIRNYSAGRYYTASYVVTVKPAPDSVALMQTRRTVGVGETISLDAVVYDAAGELTGSDYTYKSSYTSRIAANANGTITGKYPGSANITVTAYNGVKLQVAFNCVKAPTSISLNAKTLTLSETQKQQLSYSLNSGSAGSVTYSSSDPAVASVDGSGLVSAHALGSAVITVKTYNGKTASCNVTVLDEPDGIFIDEEELSLGEGASLTVRAHLNDYHAGEITYSTEQTEIISIDPATGAMKGLHAGTAVVTATTRNNKTGTVYTDTVSVTVTPAPVTVRFTTTRTAVGYGEAYVVEVEALDADNNPVPSTFTVQSSNSNYIKASGMKLTGSRTGSATITVTAYNGVKAARTFKVVAAPTSIALSDSSCKLTIGGRTYQPLVTLTSASAVSGITWASENEAIATVSEKGDIRAVSCGTTRIKATTYNGKSAMMTVTVYNMPDSVALNVHELTLGVEQKGSLTHSFPEGCYSTVVYSCDNSDVAEVSAVGAITAKAVGTCHITVTAESGVTDVCTLTVVPAPSNVRFSEASVTIGIGQKLNSAELIVIDEGSSASYTFRAESTTVLSVSADGTVTGKAAGTTRIKATTQNGLSAFLTVKVLKAPTSFRVSADREAVYQGDDVVFTPVFPASTIGEVIFTSSDESILTITPDGHAHALDIGSVTVTATCHNGVTVKTALSVRRHVSSITLDTTELTRVHYETAALTADVQPLDAYDRSVVWTSSEPETVSVDQNGNLTMLKVSASPVIITATTNDGAFTASCTVTVTPVRLTGISLSVSEAVLERGRTLDAAITYQPANADDKSVVWTSTDPSVAAADENGVITAVGDSGSAVLTCTSNDGAFTASVTVTATKVHMTALSAEESSVNVTRTRTIGLAYVLTPADADLTSAVWTVDDPAIAEVDQSGNVTGLAVGQTNVNFTATDTFGLTKRCTVLINVEPIHVDSVVLSQNSMYVRVGREKQLNVTINPFDADDQTVSWSLSDHSYVTVEPNEDGALVIAGTQAGNTTVTVRTNDGGYTDECLVKVLDTLSISALPELEQTTVGNPVTWTVGVENAIGDVSYTITVTKDGAVVYTASSYEGAVTIANTTAGEYEISVRVEDDEDTAEVTSAVTVAERLNYNDNGIVYSYVIMTTGDGSTGAAFKLESCPEATTSIRVPAVMNGAAVVRIDTEAFMGRTALVSVQIPDTVTEIGARAFKDCTALTSLTSY